MKLFKKLDDFLLHYYPTIWITRIHSFLPIGLGLAAILFLATIAVPWNPQDDLPQSVSAIVLMIIPVLIYLVYWFIFQSRYNVTKSGGHMSLGLEYLNFFSYLLVFLTAFMLISAIPLANYQRIHNVVSKAEFEEDIRKLNAGNALMYQGATYSGNGTVSYYPANFVYMDYYYDYDFAYDYSEPYDEYGSVGEVTITENKARELMSDFIKTYNKYTHFVIRESAGEIFAGLKRNYYDDYDAYYPTFMDASWEVQYKLSLIDGYFHSGSYGEYSEPWFWKIVFAIIAQLAIVIWIFKQMKLRQFVFGFISVCLTPLAIAIVAVILFEVIGIYHNEEQTISSLVLFFYLLLAVISIRAFSLSRLHNTGYVVTMYLHFFLPLLPLFLWLFFADHHYWGYGYDFESTVNILYWSGWCIGLASIAASKPLYTKFRSLPSKS